MKSDVCSHASETKRERERTRKRVVPLSVSYSPGIGSAFRYKWHPSGPEHCGPDESVSVNNLPTANPLHHDLMEHVTLIHMSLSVCVHVLFIWMHVLVCEYETGSDSAGLVSYYNSVHKYILVPVVTHDGLSSSSLAPSDRWFVANCAGQTWSLALMPPTNWQTLQPINVFTRCHFPAST